MCSEAIWKWTLSNAKTYFIPSPKAPVHSTSEALLDEYSPSSEITSATSSTSKLYFAGFGPHTASPSTTPSSKLIGDYSVPVGHTPKEKSFPLALTEKTQNANKTTNKALDIFLPIIV